MRNVVLLMGMGLDGIGAEGWIPNVADKTEQDELYDDMREDLRSIDTFLFGRVSYDIWKKYWPPMATESNSEFEREFSRFTDSVRKVVFSKTLKAVDWENSSLVKGSIPRTISRMKSEPGKNMAIVGGIGIAQTFTKLDLIDEYHLYLHPWILGDGKTLLGGIRSPRELKLSRAKAFRSGVVGLHLKRSA